MFSNLFENQNFFLWKNRNFDLDIEIDDWKIAYEFMRLIHNFNRISSFRPP